MQALEKIYHPIPHVELISCSLVSDGFVLLSFFFALLALHVFTLFHRDVYGFQVTDQRDDTLTKLSLVFVSRLPCSCGRNISGKENSGVDPACGFPVKAFDVLQMCLFKC